MAPFRFLFLFICFLSFTSPIALEAQTKVNAAKAKSIETTSPFDNIRGQWVSYARESTFAAYTTISPIAKGKGFQEFFESKNSEISIGLFFQDCSSSKWGYTWVEGGNAEKNSVGVKWLDNPSGKKFVFKGEALLNNRKVLDRMTFELINPSTLWKIYEVSTDGGISWDLEYKYIFKKIE